MASVTQSIDVHQGLSTVYNRLTQSESFPQFMEGVKEVRQLDDTHLHWVAEIVGREREWGAEIAEQIPGQRVSWTAVSGTAYGGIVTFAPLSGGMTPVDLCIEDEPRHWMEKAAQATGLTDGWRGRVAS